MLVFVERGNEALGVHDDLGLFSSRLCVPAPLIALVGEVIGRPKSEAVNTHFGVNGLCASPMSVCVLSCGFIWLSSVPYLALVLDIFTS